MKAALPQNGPRAHALYGDLTPALLRRATPLHGVERGNGVVAPQAPPRHFVERGPGGEVPGARRGTPLLFVALILLLLGVSCAMAETITVDVNAMPRIVFTGDSQTCGCVGALDYAQMLSWELPLQVFNRAVGGSNTTHLLSPFHSGTLEGKAGDEHLIGKETSFFAGPYPGQKVTLGTQEYTIDRMATTDYKARNSDLYLTEPLREDFSGGNFVVEAGWRVRVAEVKPQYAVFMFTVNDAGKTSEQYKANLAEIVKRCREASIQPLFLTGIPLMEAESGGSHPGSNRGNVKRVQDTSEFCAAEGIPFGDVFGTLMLLDDQRTSVWADTVHPTNDGSQFAVQAVRYLLSQLGVGRAGYAFHGYRAATGDLPELPAATLQPFLTSQPRITLDGKLDADHFDLATIRARDENNHVAAADGDCLTSATPFVLQFSVGNAADFQGGTTTVVVGGSARVLCYDWQAGAWQPLVAGAGKLQATLPANCLEPGATGRVWLAVRGDGPLQLDYAGLEVQVKQRTAVVPLSEAPRWPAPGQFDYPPAPANLLPNGDLALMKNSLPVGFTPTGPTALYQRAGYVAKGNGDFTGEKVINQFRCADQRFRQTVRPLDCLVIAQGPEGCTGRFLVSKVIDDEHLALRRNAASAGTGLDFEVMRSSGCLAVPGGHMIECSGGDTWHTTLKGLKAGKYEVGVFYRAFDPAAMNATHQPGAVARWTLSGGTPTTSVLDSCFLWQRATQVVDVSAKGVLSLQVGATGGARAQFTGFSVVKVP